MSTPESTRTGLNQESETAAQAFEKAKAAEQKKAEGVKDAVASFLVSPNSGDAEKIAEERPSDKEMDGYPKLRTNDRHFSLKELDDGTNVEAGQTMENVTRYPAHEADEIAIEEDTPGFDTIVGITPRGNPVAGASDEEAKKLNEAK